MLRIVEDRVDGVVKFYLNDKFVGLARGSVYVTRRRKEHFFRKFNGFGISKSILEWLNRNGIYKVLIIYENEDKSEVLLKSDITQWIYSGIEWVDSSNGFADVQLVLPVLEMEIEGKPDFWRV